jgi:hypothetical protein
MLFLRRVALGLAIFGSVLSPSPVYSQRPPDITRKADIHCEVIEGVFGAFNLQPDWFAAPSIDTIEASERSPSSPLRIAERLWNLEVTVPSRRSDC